MKMATNFKYLVAVYHYPNQCPVVALEAVAAEGAMALFNRTLRFFS